MDIEKYIGRLLDNRYEILEVIGTGGMAVVYKARCHRLNRLVAIKILKDDLSQDEEFKRRFHAESQAVAMLSHPNIMSVYDVSTSEEADYIVMELIDGITLKQYMEKKGVLNWKETLHFAMQIAKALEHAHSRGIVHRDIKPHNVMVLKNGSVKVTDFGIARIMSKSNTLTKEALGSVHYISPEQAKGGRVDNRSDIYSLGVVMYEMMTGRAPYDGESPVAVAIQHINGGAAMPSTLNPNIPGGLEQIIMKSMAVDPAQRYNTATALLYDLEEFRKNPSMLFYFNEHNAGDLPRMPVAAPVQPAPQPPKTTAERMAGVRTAPPASQPRPRPVEQPAIRQERSDVQQRAAARARQEREQRQESSNQTMTMVVVACSAIAVIAIVIFLIVLLNGGLFNNETSVVKAPNLIGQVWDELDHSKYPNVQIVLGDMDFSDDVDAGLIMEQKPEAGDSLPVGDQVKVWVSLGPEQEELPSMMDLTGKTQDEANNYLIALNGGLILDVQSENSEDVEEGKIIRTEPAAGEALERGQTVTIWLSTGPEVKMLEVPRGVIGIDKDDAEKLLRDCGFENVDTEPEASLEPENTVTKLSVEVGEKIDATTEIIIYYSSGEMYEKMPKVVGMEVNAAKEELDNLKFTSVTVVEEYNDTVEMGFVISTNIPEGTKIDVTTAIVLTVSKGPEPTEAPTEEPTEPPTEPERKVTVTVQLPKDRTEDYQLTVLYNGEAIVDQMMDPTTGSFAFQLSGTGVGYVEIYIDGEYVRTQKVNFDA